MSVELGIEDKVLVSISELPVTLVIPQYSTNPNLLFLNKVKKMLYWNKGFLSHSALWLWIIRSGSRGCILRAWGVAVDCLSTWRPRCLSPAIILAALVDIVYSYLYRHIFGYESNSQNLFAYFLYYSLVAFPLPTLNCYSRAKLELLYSRICTCPNSRRSFVLYFEWFAIWNDSHICAVVSINWSCAVELWIV